jgi:thiamine biosynthesis lipoprotein
MQRLDFRAMGCQMLALVDSLEASASEILTQVPAWFAEWEQGLSRFRDDSELNALNRARGKPLRVSETLWQVLDAAIEAAQASDGLVTPTVLDALCAAGYTTSFEHIARAEDAPLATPPLPIPDWRAIERETTTRTVRLPAGLRLDLGGVAKGWAADTAARRLAAIAPTMVDAGGDIALSGARANGEPWTIAIANPFEPDADLEVLSIMQGGVATSGRDYRRWQQHGRLQHHIIDPRTGAPAETDVLTATIVAPTTVQAEVAAKVVVILGSRAGLEWLEAHPALAGLLVCEDGRLIASSRLADFVWREPYPGLEVVEPFTT